MCPQRGHRTEGQHDQGWVSEGRDKESAGKGLPGTAGSTESREENIQLVRQVTVRDETGDPSPSLNPLPKEHINSICPTSFTGL